MTLKVEAERVWTNTEVKERLMSLIMTAKGVVDRE